ncbi:formate dehydrogenase accessory sulfurtransferase FdhD [Candidatus Methylomirabilis sp.]|uniref:Sulfur carrier protein FdhD n=1 Tax=Candidatus Methylomirabilis tolerans TaxID=3123416 RepID=A0AAJ1ET51_9BACT|nr:formate dehydrogenase accessory sulfurtransferase FdhD [Candidatus Methylomirabilis sp.]
MTVHRIVRYRGGSFETVEIPVVGEQALTIFVNGHELATLLCTPVKLDCLVVGFLSFEGIIRTLDEVRSLEVFPEEAVADVRLTGAFIPPHRRVVTSGCSGGITFSMPMEGFQSFPEEATVHPKQPLDLMKQLYAEAYLYRESRGIHAAALSDGKSLLLVAEDVGRHNALDKIHGEALLRGIPTAGNILLSTGRISSEMLRKGAHMRTPFVISRTSPTSLAIAAAKRFGITVIGYCRGDGFNVYSHPERLLPQRMAIGSVSHIQQLTANS